MLSINTIRPNRKRPRSRSWRFPGLAEDKLYAWVKAFGYHRKKEKGRPGKRFRRHVDITYFNLEGKMDRKPRRIEYRHISQIGFRERYIKGYQRYIDW